jgi:catechol 2,3-dioxygenase-like lactoylglutathione lyase family enzyme
MPLISGAHVMIFTRDEDADRAFLRDVLEVPCIDGGGGWLIYKLPPAEMGVHGGEQNDVHHLYFMTDSLDEAMAQLASKGVDCGAPFNASWGRATSVPLPGGGKIGLYEPRHARP